MRSEARVLHPGRLHVPSNAELPVCPAHSACTHAALATSSMRLSRSACCNAPMPAITTRRRPTCFWLVTIADRGAPHWPTQDSVEDE